MHGQGLPSASSQLAQAAVCRPPWPRAVRASRWLLTGASQSAPSHRPEQSGRCTPAASSLPRPLSHVCYGISGLLPGHVRCRHPR